MATSNVPRTRRVGEQLRRELAELIRSELDDPRLALISMTSVEVSRNLRYARIFVTLVGDTAQRQELVDELNRAAPLLRHALGKRLHLRTIPQLDFRYDEVTEHGARLSALIDAAVAADRNHAHNATEEPPQ